MQGWVVRAKKTGKYVWRTANSRFWVDELDRATVWERRGDAINAGRVAFRAAGKDFTTKFDVLGVVVSVHLNVDHGGV